MGGLTTSLFMGVQALEASEAALNATSNNIANANTPGYARGRTVQRTPEPDWRYRERRRRLARQHPERARRTAQPADPAADLVQGSADTQSSILQQLQTYFSSTGSDIGSSLSAFSSSLAELSANPSNAAVQQSVLSAGQNLAGSFNNTASG